MHYLLALKRKEYQKALEALRKVVSLDPKDGETYMKMTTVYLLLNRRDDALKTYKKALELGEKPKNHDLMSFETPRFYGASEKHKKGRFFLYAELKQRGIIGIKPGITKNMKVSTFGLSREEVKTILDAFKDIAK